MIRKFRPAYILIGSNINPEENIRRAVLLLKSCVAVHRLSTVWETPAVGIDGPNFYNVAVEIKTRAELEHLKGILRKIESQLGRVRTGNKYAPRTIDLDIIIFGDQLLEPNLWRLAFIFVPIAELLPELSHPETFETIDQLAKHFLSQGDLVPHPEVLINLAA